MCKRARFLASLLAETETATEPGIRKSAGSILRQDVSADIFLLRGGMEGATLPALPVLQARFWCPRSYLASGLFCIRVSFYFHIASAISCCSFSNRAISSFKSSQASSSGMPRPAAKLASASSSMALISSMVYRRKGGSCCFLAYSVNWVASQIMLSGESVPVR